MKIALRARLITGGTWFTPPQRFVSGIFFLYSFTEGLKSNGHSQNTCASQTGLNSFTLQYGRRVVQVSRTLHSNSSAHVNRLRSSFHSNYCVVVTKSSSVV